MLNLSICGLDHTLIDLLNKMIKYVSIKNSDKPDKRMVAVFYDENKQRVKTTHFGYQNAQTGKYGSTYIDHNDDKKKENYIKRHAVNENFNDYISAGSLSRYILWNRKTLQSSINDYMNKFNLKRYS